MAPTYQDAQWWNNGAEPLVSSRNNPLIKHIRSLDSRKERERSGVFFVEGLHGALSAVEHHAPVETCVFAPELLVSAHGRALVEDLRARGVRCVATTADVFQSLASREYVHGVGLVVRQTWHTLASVRTDASQCWVALDTVQYPGNLGTIIRTCDAIGGAGIMLFGNTTDPYDPAAVRASVGTLFSQRLVRASFAEFTAWRRQHGVRVVGTSPAATLDYRRAAYQGPLVLLMGSEARGLSAEQFAQCDAVVTIPMVGSGDSLNLAVATGVLLYEIFTQQQAQS